MMTDSELEDVGRREIARLNSRDKASRELIEQQQMTIAELDQFRHIALAVCIVCIVVVLVLLLSVGS
jgi:type VI protein secretion system component VasF